MSAQDLHSVSSMLDALAHVPEEPGDLTGTLKHIAKTAKNFFASDVCTTVAINSITRRFVESLTLVGDTFTNITYEEARPDSVTSEILKEDFLFVEDIESESEYKSHFVQMEGIRSFAAVTLHTRDRQRQLGVLYLNFRHPHLFSLGERQLLQIFADQASFLLQETWLLFHCREVEQIGQEINQDLATIELLFQKLQKYVVNILNASYTLLLGIYQPQTSTLDFYIQEEGQFFIEPNKSLGGACDYVIRTKETQFIQHLSHEKDQLPFSIVTVPGTRPQESYVFVPLILRDEALGVLSIQHPEPNAYSQEDIFILELLANHIALALHNIRLYNNLSRLSETGQYLTQQLDSEHLLQAIVDQIYNDTKADVAILYDYDPTNQHFGHPYVAGQLYHPSARQFMYPSHPDDVAKLMVHRSSPIFARESTTVYNTLQGEGSLRQGNFVERENIRSTAAIRLSVRDVVVGVLFINFRQPQRFDAPQKLHIEVLASYAAISIKTSQVFTTSNQRRTREATILQNIHRDLNSNLDLKPVLETLLQQANALVLAEDATILLYNSRLQMLETQAAIGRNATAYSSLVVPLQGMKGITRWVWEHKKPARVNHAYRDAEWKDFYLQTETSTISELDIPLVDGEEVVGVLNFESSRESAFSEDDTRFLLTLAGQTVLAVKKAQAYEREKRLAEEREALYQISKEIVSQLNAVSVFDLILEKALELTKSTRGALLLYDPDRNKLRMVAEHGTAEDKKNVCMSMDQGILGYVATHKRLLNVNVDRPPWDRVYIAFTEGIRSELAVPMLKEDDIHGVLNVESPEPNHFSESDERLLQGLADLAVVALQMAEHYEKAKEAEKRAESTEMMGWIGQFIFEVAHRQGNDLGLVKSYVNDVRSELRKREVISATIDKKLGNIVQDTRAVLETNEEIKKVMTTFRTFMMVEPVVIHPRELLEGAQEEAQRLLSSLPRSSIVLQPLRIANDAASIRAIHALVVDILRNLVKNAVEAMAEGGGTLSLEALNDRAFVALEVIDTGIGIPLEQQKKVFELAYSTKSSTGFGLWSAQRSARYNQGDLVVSSRPGYTIFTLRLPRADGSFWRKL